MGCGCPDDGLSIYFSSYYFLQLNFLLLVIKSFNVLLPKAVCALHLLLLS